MQTYQRKYSSAEGAVSLIQDNENVYVSGNMSIPFALLRALSRKIDKPKGVQLLHFCMLQKEPTMKKGMEAYFRHNSFFAGPDDREAIAEGRADVIPVHLHDIPTLIREGLVSIDTVLTQASPPDSHGFMSLGVEIGATPSAIKKAKRVIVQINEFMPRVLGNSFVHVSQVHHLVEHHEELPEMVIQPYTDVERKIASGVCGLIEDNSTLQVGVGSIPDAIVNLLDGKKDLGIHTEAMSNGIMKAVQKGIITGRSKTLDAEKVVTTFIMGTKELYQFVHGNPLVEARSVEYTNNPFIISQQDKMIAINTAIEIDLTGQVCADSIGTRIYSGFGGQVDFIRGAALSNGGKPIIALSSTAKNGEISRIVPLLKPGAGVVTTRADIHYIVTEYGIVNLYGKNLRERARALISLAHPRFRESLERAAFERKLLSTELP